MKLALALVLGFLAQAPAFAFSDLTLNTLAFTTIGSWGSTAITVKPENKELYLAAADDAAQFVAQDATEPTALLRQAMEVEREYLHELGRPEADQLTDHDLAVLVMDRAALFVGKAKY